ncbi:unnamed protein product, partial [Urochloa humidicola]
TTLIPPLGQPPPCRASFLATSRRNPQPIHSLSSFHPIISRARPTSPPRLHLPYLIAPRSPRVIGCVSRGAAIPFPSMAAGEEKEAAAMVGPGGDKLILRGLQFHGFHGVMQEEQTLGQKFVVDIDAWMDLYAAGESDSIADTVSYTDIYGIAKDVVEGMPHNLLESVAHSIAKATLLKFPQISTVRVKVGKPHVAVQGVLDYLGVEIMRHRKKA